MAQAQAQMGEWRHDMVPTRSTRSTRSTWPSTEAWAWQAQGVKDCQVPEHSHHRQGQAWVQGVRQAGQPGERLRVTERGIRQSGGHSFWVL